MEHTFNLTPLLIALGQAVPVWAIVALAVTTYLRKSKTEREALSKRLDVIEDNILSIKLSLASAGIDRLDKDIEELREAKAHLTSEVVSLWRALEDHRIERSVSKGRRDHD